MRNAIHSLFLLFGVMAMGVSGAALSAKLGATWEFGLFAIGIIIGCTAPVYPLARRLAQLEQRMTELSARAGQ